MRRHSQTIPSGKPARLRGRPRGRGALTEALTKIAERFGYVYEDTLRKRNFERGRRVDLLIWGLLADERPVRESTLR